MELKPCSKCGKRVSDLDIRNGDGANLNNRFYCRACAGDMNIEIKSDYSAVGSLQGKKSLSDTQFFKRAGKLFDNVDRKREKVRRGRGRKKEPFSRKERGASPSQKIKPPQQLKNSSENTLNVILIGGVVIIILLIIVIIAIITK